MPRVSTAWKIPIVAYSRNSRKAASAPASLAAPRRPERAFAERGRVERVPHHRVAAAEHHEGSALAADLRVAVRFVFEAVEPGAGVVV